MRWPRVPRLPTKQAKHDGEVARCSPSRATQEEFCDHLYPVSRYSAPQHPCRTSPPRSLSTYAILIERTIDESVCLSINLSLKTSVHLLLVRTDLRSIVLSFHRSLVVRSILNQSTTLPYSYEYPTHTNKYLLNRHSLLDACSSSLRRHRRRRRFFVVVASSLRRRRFVVVAAADSSHPTRQRPIRTSGNIYIQEYKDSL